MSLFFIVHGWIRSGQSTGLELSPCTNLLNDFQIKMLILSNFEGPRQVMISVLEQVGSSVSGLLLCRGREFMNGCGRRQARSPCGVLPVWKCYAVYLSCVQR